MRLFRNRFLILIFCSCIMSPALQAQKKIPVKELLRQSFQLAPPHSRDTQYYRMESRLQQHSPDGAPLGWDVYRLYLRCVPSHDGKPGDEYTCLKFTVTVNKATEVSIPSLVNWKYIFALTASNRDQEGKVFGIDHAKFENITDENGKALAAGNAYHVYNAFIDFHAMQVFSEKTLSGGGIQDLKHIGDRVVHVASFSQPPVDLGSQVDSGSYFKNGEVTLNFKGLGTIHDHDCSIIEYDSGESSFFMIMKPMPNLKINTKGSSHYWGDIFKDLKTGWIQKASLREWVVSETIIPGQNSPVHSVIERSIEISNVESIAF